MEQRMRMFVGVYGEDVVDFVVNIVGFLDLQSVSRSSSGHSRILIVGEIEICVRELTRWASSRIDWPAMCASSGLSLISKLMI